MKNRVRTRLARVVRLFPLSRRGVALAVAGAAIIWTQGLRQEDLVLLAAGLVVLGMQTILLLLTAIATIFAYRGVRLASSRGTLELETETTQDTGFEARFPTWFPLVSFNWTWDSPEGCETRLDERGGRIIETVTPGRRSAVDAIRRRFIIRDFLGLSEISFLRKETQNVRILPARLRGADLEYPLGLPQGEDIPDETQKPAGDKIEMREYRPGDSPRLIRWKLYARTGKLLVRTPERSASELPSTCAYLAGGGPGSEPAARLARELLERGALGNTWRFGADGGDQPSVGDLDSARNLIARSGNADVECAGGLALFLSDALNAGFSDCVVIAPAAAILESKRLKEALAQSPVTIRLVAAVPKLVDPAKRSFWRRFLFRPDGPRWANLDFLRSSLHRGGPVHAAAMLFELESGAFIAL